MELLSAKKSVRIRPEVGRDGKMSIVETENQGRKMGDDLSTKSYHLYAKTFMKTLYSAEVALSSTVWRWAVSNIATISKAFSC